MSDERCETCRFWKLDGSVNGVTNGDCRRFPPIAQPEVIRSSIPPCDIILICPTWAETNGKDWCGEYQPRPDAVSNEVVDLPPPVGSN